jgi:ribosomal protein S18 acetylase RimI-like enzyme
MKIIKLDHKDLMKQNLTMLTNVIYDNFPELIDTPNVTHSPESIRKTLESRDIVLLLAMNNNKLLGYLLGEIMILEDGRKVLFISYLFVAPSMRNNGLGKKLMFEAYEVAGNEFCDGIMLIYDTTDRQLRNFYGKLGFMLDFNMRRYERNDVFYKVIN